MFAQTAFILSLVAVTQSANVTSPTTSTNTSHGCVLAAVDPTMHLRVKEFADMRTKLLEYQITIQGYNGSDNPLTTNMMKHYQADHWHRVFKHHGRVLLSLAFNYDMLSLTLLKIGVENLAVELKDMPQGCLEELPEEDKITLVRELLMRDFVEGKDDIWLDDEDYVCHQIIGINPDGRAQFGDECCTRTRIQQKMVCQEEEKYITITVLYYLIIFIKVGFFLFGPLYLQKWVLSDSTEKKTYAVSMSDPLHALVTGREVKRYGKSEDTKDHVEMKDEEFKTFEFKTLHVTVDHQKLMNEKKVPIGFFKFVFDTFLRCHIADHEPFKSCCSHSIFGSWTRYFLCLPLLKNEAKCNLKCKAYCSWRAIFRLIGRCIMFALVSLPFILRIVIFYFYEQPEIESRLEKMEKHNIEVSADHSYFQHLTPMHSFFITAYVIYVTSFILLGLCKFKFSSDLDQVVRPAFHDLQGISYMESIRMVIAHLILPFEKFGMCGFLISVLYLPIALCVCLIALACYCIPTIYMIGRLLIHQRPSCFSWPLKKDSDSPQEGTKKYKHSLSGGTIAVDEILFLRSISSNKHEKNSVKKPDQQPILEEPSSCLRILIGLLCIINMCTLLGMYAEVLGFLAEILVLTLMGAIVNASTAHKYVMLVFWITMYASSCFNKVYEAYFKVNSKIFNFLKGKLGEKVLAYIIQPEDEQEDTAFKFFTRKEVQELQEKRMKAANNLRRRPLYRSVSNETYEEELIRGKNGRLFWNTYSLALFVDQYDVPRIPKRLFYMISQQELVGCPGPVYKSWARALRNLGYMIFFLLFVFVIIMTFGNIYNISSTNQLLLTAVGGFIPDIIRRVLQPKVDLDVDLNTYTFQGKIQEFMCSYSQEWPVAKLSWTRIVEEGEETAMGGDREREETEAEVENNVHHRGTNSTCDV